MSKHRMSKNPDNDKMYVQACKDQMKNNKLRMQKWTWI